MTSLREYLGEWKYQRPGSVVTTGPQGRTQKEAYIATSTALTSRLVTLAVM